MFLFVLCLSCRCRLLICSINCIFKGFQDNISCDIFRIFGNISMDVRVFSRCPKSSRLRLSRLAIVYVNIFWNWACYPSTQEIWLLFSEFMQYCWIYLYSDKIELNCEKLCTFNEWRFLSCWRDSPLSRTNSYHLHWRSFITIQYIPIIIWKRYSNVLNG